MVLLSGWGRYPRIDCARRRMRDRQDARAVVTTTPSLIARGNGRAYGDAALNGACVLETRPSDRILAFDAATGLILCEAGLLLADLLDFAVPRGFFPPVVPGTRFVTIGGMVAADIHGKNHHGAGSFGRHIEAIELMLADGSIVRSSPTEENELFLATCGGMGLTGVILTVAFRLMPIGSAMIRQRTIRTGRLDELLTLFDSEQATYSVAWLDCLASGEKRGRALLYLGEHAETGGLGVPRRRSIGVPVDLPSFVLNGRTARAFNETYHRMGRPGSSLLPYDRYFFPLDRILDWNRLYGQAGFLQYQCVVPRTDDGGALEALIDRIAQSGEGAFLAVLKLFGPADAGFLSFPMEGYTLALDFPVRGSVLTLLDTLDAIVATAGGRVYLAKDARMSSDMVRQTYPQLDRFRAVRAAVDPGRRFASAQSIRLGL